MQYLLDYLASVILGAALIFIMISANETVAENHSLYNGDMMVQEMLVQTAYLLEGELRNMGVGVPETGSTILWADTSRIRFQYDLDRNGTPDTIQYFVGTTNDMIDTPNELDRPLYRQVNGAPPLVVGSVTVFRLRYIARPGDILSTPVVSTSLSEIYSVEITLEVQNPYAMMRTPEQVKAGERNAFYSSSLWQQTRLASQNTRR
jgi:hypothetical protein